MVEFTGIILPMDDYSRKVELGRELTKNNGYNGGNGIKNRNIANNIKHVNVWKNWLVSRLFWGRSNYYKNISHSIVAGLTFLIVVSGLIIRISSVTNSASASINFGSTISGTDDLLQQGGSIGTVLLSSTDTGLSVKWTKYEVKKEDTLISISEEVNISEDTIKSANRKNYPSLFLSGRLEEGWVLDIPDINGVIHEVRAGETIDSIAERYTSEGNTEANNFNVIEFNALSEPYILEPGQHLFIPDGNTRILTDDTHLDLEALRGSFIDPLSHPECTGYRFSRGYTSYHNGIDLAKWDGCTIVAVADGVVEYAGWASQGQGNMVRINHGGGIKTEYFHGSGVFWVKAGDIVDQNQPILGMGSTGYSTGVHLHFILWKDGIAIDPSSYVPYNSSY